MITETFNYSNITNSDNSVTYNSITAQKLIFAEGFGVKRNPFFQNLPLNGSKGELLIIHVPNLKLDFVIKSSVFLIPLAEDNYIVGATYNRTDKTNDITTEAKEELLTKLKSFLKCDFQVIDQVAGIRPTV